MRHLPIVTLLFAVVSAAFAPEARAQTDWRPPSADMPMMPRASELQGDWLTARAAWFGGVEGVSGVSPRTLSASGHRRAGSDHVQIARFVSGHLPVVVWSDRNGDDRADMIEIYRSAGVIIQIIDADFSGRANVMRVYDAAGALLREERL